MSFETEDKKMMNKRYMVKAQNLLKDGLSDFVNTS